MAFSSVCYGKFSGIPNYLPGMGACFTIIERGLPPPAPPNGSAAPPASASAAGVSAAAPLKLAQPE